MQDMIDVRSAAAVAVATASMVLGAFTYQTFGQEAEVPHARSILCVDGWVPKDGNVTYTYSHRILPCGQTATPRAEPRVISHPARRQVSTAVDTEIPPIVYQQIRDLCEKRHPADFALRAGCVRLQVRGYLETR